MCGAVPPCIAAFGSGDQQGISKASGLPPLRWLLATATDWGARRPGGLQATELSPTVGPQVLAPCVGRPLSSFRGLETAFQSDRKVGNRYPDDPAWLHRAQGNLQTHPSRRWPSGVETAATVHRKDDAGACWGWPLRCEAQKRTRSSDWRECGRTFVPMKLVPGGEFRNYQSGPRLGASWPRRARRRDGHEEWSRASQDRSRTSIRRPR